MTAPNEDLARGLRALDEAVQRHAHAFHVDSGNPAVQLRRLYAAIGEALMWAAILDDACKNDPQQQIPGYENRRTAQAADLLDGMRYLRNRLVHRVIQPPNDERYDDYLLDHDSGQQISMRIPYWVWRPASDFPGPPPRPKQGWRDAQDRLPAYERHWQGHSVDSRLGDLVAWFYAVIDPDETIDLDNS